MGFIFVCVPSISGRNTNLNSREIVKSNRVHRPDAAKKTDKSYCVNREVVCTLPKFGGNSALRPSVVSKKRNRHESTLGASSK